MSRLRAMHLILFRLWTKDYETPRLAAIFSQGIARSFVCDGNSVEQFMQSAVFSVQHILVLSNIAKAADDSVDVLK